MTKKQKPQHNPYKRKARLERRRDQLEKLEIIAATRRQRGETASLASLTADVAHLKRALATILRSLDSRPPSPPPLTGRKSQPSPKAS